MEIRTIRIASRSIGAGFPVFVIAEIGINHNGDVGRAAKLIDAAVECGVDAVKFQTFRADRLLVQSRDRYAQQGAGIESAHEMFRRLELSCEAHEKLKAHADRLGVVFLSTPFDEESADFLEQLGVVAFKIASCDVTHIPLLRRIALKKRPIIMSTGMSLLSEVADAVWTLRSSGSSDIVLLHCVSAYPAPPDSLNLRAIQTLRDHFNLPVGYSDHSEGTLHPLGAVALGAHVHEKHFTLAKSDAGPDHKSSADPDEMKLLIRSVRALEASLGDGTKRPAGVEERNRELARRSIVAAVDIQADEMITSGMLTYKRPGTGLEPRLAARVIGRRARRVIPRDSLIEWAHLSTTDPVSCDGEEPGLEPVASTEVAS